MLAGLRIALGWVFLWAFLDKLFGLGFATAAENAWINGGCPPGLPRQRRADPFAGIYHGSPARPGPTGCS